MCKGHNTMTSESNRRVGSGAIFAEITERERRWPCFWSRIAVTSCVVISLRGLKMRHPWPRHLRARTDAALSSAEANGGESARDNLSAIVAIILELK